MGESITVHGRRVPVISPGGISGGKLTAPLPIGPQWGAAGGRYLLGADQLGRDLAVRLLYGGRISLLIGLGATALAACCACLLALAAAFFGGWLDFAISRTFDLFYAFPVVLLGIALGSAFAVGGINWQIGPLGIHLHSGSLWLPLLAITLTMIPYTGRPLRGQLLSLRQQPFIEAAVSVGAGPLRIMVAELLPNLASPLLMLATLTVANAITLEAALSFLGAGVQDPQASWGKLVADGQQLMLSRPLLTIAPGVAIALTVLALNALADQVRETLDPHSRRRV